MYIYRCIHLSLSTSLYIYIYIYAYLSLSLSCSFALSLSLALSVSVYMLEYVRVCTRELCRILTTHSHLQFKHHQMVGAVVWQHNTPQQARKLFPKQ